MKRLALLAFVMCLVLPAFARQRISVWCEQGNGTVTVGGLSATTKWMQSFPSATVSIFDTGTTNLSTIYADNAGTTKANPFTCASDGFAFFYLDSGARVDIKLSGTGVTTPFTKADYLAFDPVQLTTTLNAMSFSAIPTFDAGAASIFTMTLTGNVTSSTITNSLRGQIIEFSLCQDATGSRTFSWPASFIRPPPVNPTANSCSDSAFFYNGTNWRHIGSGDSAGFAGDLTVSGAINPSGGFSNNLLPNANNTYDLGSSTFKWRDGWFSRNLAVAGTATLSSDLSVTGNTTLTGAISVGTTLTVGVGGSANLNNSPLKNATLTGTSNGNAVTLLNWQSATGTLTGNSADQTTFTYTLPANTLGQGKGVRVTFAWQHLTGAANPTYRIFFGATQVQGIVSGAAGAGFTTGAIIMNNPSSTTAQTSVSQASYTGSTFQGGFDPGTPAENTAGSIIIKGTVNLPVTDTFKGSFWMVELIQ